MKKVYIIIVLIIIGSVIYFTGLYTYFTKNEVQELLPTPSAGTKVQQSEILATGAFQEIDIIHKGSGTAKLIKNGDKKILRFENFTVTNGPDLYIYLSHSTEPNGNLKSLGNFINLGLLKGNIGNQNYEIPTNATGYNTVVIWCQKFGVLFSYAVMR